MHGTDDLGEPPGAEGLRDEPAHTGRERPLQVPAPPVSGDDQRLAAGQFRPQGCGDCHTVGARRPVHGRPHAERQGERHDERGEHDPAVAAEEGGFGAGRRAQAPQRGGAGGEGRAKISVRATEKAIPRTASNPPP
ncbi:hypothetical protein ACE1SV_30900 [Streptomyces sp. E-15]